MPVDNKIEIHNNDLADPQNQTTVKLIRANKDTALWFTKDPGSGNNKYAQYWIAFDNDPFSEHVIATDAVSGKTDIFHARNDGPRVVGTYTIYDKNPKLLRIKPLTAGGGGIIIDN